ncbi:MAG: molybdenum cofactor guanylyltransferase [Candidatus Methanosuratincola petrocarbonis]
MRKLAVAIAAGGASIRLGSPKPFVELGGARLLDYALDYAFNASDEVYLLARDSDLFPPSVFIGGKAPRVIIDDDRGTPPDRIAGSLRRIRSDLVFLMGCDMPFLDPCLPQLLLSRIGDHGAAVPAWRNGYIEPLAAVYSIPMIPEGRGIGSMRDLCGAMDPVFVGMEEAQVPPWTFLNINTREDLSSAERLLKLFLSRRSSCGRSNIPRCPTSRCR